MRKTIGEMVREFHETFDHPVRKTPQVIDNTEVDDVMSWIFFNGSADPNDTSELEELLTALANNDLPEIADALGDIAYMIYGFAWRHGIDLDEVVQEIHRSNMSKLGPDGKPVYYPGTTKIGKGPDWSPADIKGVLEIQAHRAKLRDPVLVLDEPATEIHNIGGGLVIHGEARSDVAHWPLREMRQKDMR